LFYLLITIHYSVNVIDCVVVFDTSHIVEKISMELIGYWSKIQLALTDNLKVQDKSHHH